MAIVTKQSIGSVALRNAMFVYGGYALRTVSPLLVLPALSRYLGPQHYGALLLAISFSTVSTMFVEFGFPNSAPRDVANAEGLATLKGCVWSVVAAKWLLVLPAALASLLFTYLAPSLKSHAAFCTLGSALGICIGLNTAWYFQGRNRMWVSALIDAMTTIAYAGSALILVGLRAPASYVLLAQIGCMAAGAISGHALILRDIGAPAFKVADIVTAYRNGATLFLVRGFTALYASASGVLVGLWSTPTQVSFYSCSEKLVSLGVNVFPPLSQVFFPVVAVKFANGERSAFRIVRRLLTFVGSAGIAGAAMISLGSASLIHIVYGSKYGSASECLRVLAWMLPLAVINQVLAGQLLITNRRDRAVTLAVAMGGMCNVGFGYFFILRHGGLGMAIARTLSELTVFVVLLGAIVRYGLWQPLWGERKVAVADVAPTVEIPSSRQYAVMGEAPSPLEP